MPRTRSCEILDHARRERLADELAILPVLGRVHVEHDLLHVRQVGGRRIAEQRPLPLRREQLRVLRDELEVLVLGDRPEPGPVLLPVPEDGRLAPQQPEHLVRRPALEHIGIGQVDVAELERGHGREACPPVSAVVNPSSATIGEVCRREPRSSRGSATRRMTRLEVAPVRDKSRTSIAASRYFCLSRETAQPYSSRLHVGLLFMSVHGISVSAVVRRRVARSGSSVCQSPSAPRPVRRPRLLEQVRGRSPCWTVRPANGACVGQHDDDLQARPEPRSSRRPLAGGHAVDGRRAVATCRRCASVAALHCGSSQANTAAAIGSGMAQVCAAPEEWLTDGLDAGPRYTAKGAVSGVLYGTVQLSLN